MGLLGEGSVNSDCTSCSLVTCARKDSGPSAASLSEHKWVLDLQVEEN